MANKVVAVTLVARTAPYVAQMAAAAKATAGVGAAAGTAAAAAQPLGRSLRNAARQTGILNPKLIGGAGLAFGLKSVVGQAKDFEDQFAMVRKTMQESDEVLDQVALNIRELATGLPVTTRELNEIATVAGQLGIAADDVSDFTETIAKLSMATNLTAEGAAIDFARLSNIMGKPITEVEELGNVVVHLGNNMAAQETEIMEFAKRIAGVGTQMGMTEQDILALSATLPDLGLRAEMGGTAITRIMVELNKAVTESGEKLGIFAQTAGMSAEEFSAAWRADPADTLLEFTAGIGRMSDEGADAFATIADLDLSMIRTQDTALRLAGGTERYQRAQALANTETDRQAALQIEVEKRMRTTESQWKILKNNVREAALEIGGPLNESLGRTLTLLNDIWSGRPQGGIAGAIAEAMPDGTLIGRDPVTGEERNLLQAMWSGMQGAIDPSGPARDLWMNEWSNRAEFGQMAIAAMEQPFGLADYEEEFLKLNNQMGNTPPAAKAAADAIEGVGDAAADTRTSIERLNDNLDDMIGVNLNAESAAIRVEQGFHDLNETLQKSTKIYDDNDEVIGEQAATLDRSTQAGRDNERAIIAQAEAILGEIRARHEQKDSLAEIAVSYATQVDRLKDVMRQAGLTEDEIEAYIQTLGLTPDAVVTTVQAETGAATSAVDAFIRATGRIPRFTHTTVNVSANTAALDRANERIRASGGTVMLAHTGGYIHPSGNIQRFHSGGMVGGLRQDEVPAILQTGEMVLNRNQVAQIGAAFSNARERFAAPTVRGNDGNTVSIQQTFAADVSRETLAEARHQQRIAFLEAV